MCKDWFRTIATFYISYLQFKDYLTDLKVRLWCTQQSNCETFVLFFPWAFSAVENWTDLNTAGPSAVSRNVTTECDVILLRNVQETVLRFGTRWDVLKKENIYFHRFIMENVEKRSRKARFFCTKADKTNRLRFFLFPEIVYAFNFVCRVIVGSIYLLFIYRPHSWTKNGSRKDIMSMAGVWVSKDTVVGVSQHNLVW